MALEEGAPVDKSQVLLSALARVLEGLDTANDLAPEVRAYITQEDRIEARDRIKKIITEAGNIRMALEIDNSEPTKTF